MSTSSLLKRNCYSSISAYPMLTSSKFNRFCNPRLAFQPPMMMTMRCIPVLFFLPQILLLLAVTSRESNVVRVYLQRLNVGRLTLPKDTEQDPHTKICLSNAIILLPVNVSLAITMSLQLKDAVTAIPKHCRATAVLRFEGSAAVGTAVNGFKPQPCSRHCSGSLFFLDIFHLYPFCIQALQRALQ